MKAPITFRSTLSNASWTQRGAAALLLVAALIFTLTLVLRANTHAPASAPAVRQAARLAGSSAVVGASQAAPRYLLGGHGELVAGASNAQAARRITAVSPALIGTGSAYNGQLYQAAPPVAAPASPALIGTGSAYNGQLYQAAPPVAAPASSALIGTGSAYDGR
jgi:hypothetical protein